jgi:hypothetical protein
MDDLIIHARRLDPALSCHSPALAHWRVIYSFSFVEIALYTCSRICLQTGHMSIGTEKKFGDREFGKQ